MFLVGVWQSGQLHQTVNLTGIALRWFESIRPHFDGSHDGHTGHDSHNN